MKKLPESEKLKAWFTYRANKKTRAKVKSEASKLGLSNNDYLTYCHEKRTGQ